MADSNTTNVEPDDWVAFMNNGHIVIGQVEYIVADRVATWEKSLYTTAGLCPIRNVLEVRRAQSRND